MHGKGTFFDPRLDDAAKFPIAAANGFGHIRTNPDDDLITSKLPALQFYQLAIPSPLSKILISCRVLLKSGLYNAGNQGYRTKRRSGR